MAIYGDNQHWRTTTDEGTSCLLFMFVLTRRRQPSLRHFTNLMSIPHSNAAAKFGLAFFALHRVLHPTEAPTLAKAKLTCVVHIFNLLVGHACAHLPPSSTCQHSTQQNATTTTTTTQQQKQQKQQEHQHDQRRQRIT